MKIDCVLASSYQLIVTPKLRDDDDAKLLGQIKERKKKSMNYIRMAKVMKAILVKEFGDASVCKLATDVPIPEVKPTEVRRIIMHVYNL